jgi:hypothetical protein
MIEHKPCQWCGAHHINIICPRVKAIDFYPDGTHKRVEFKTEMDYVQLQHVAPSPTIEPRYPYPEHPGGCRD